MKKQSKRAQMQDVLQMLGYADSNGRVVVEDDRSLAIAPTPGKAAVIKMLCESFDQKLKTVGLILKDACITWESDESAGQVYLKLRQLDLVPETSALSEAV